jgi:hypothetical protein
MLSQHSQLPHSAFRLCLVSNHAVSVCLVLSSVCLVLACDFPSLYAGKLNCTDPHYQHIQEQIIYLNHFYYRVCSIFHAFCYRA